ncbi:hypothetical protein Tco_0678723 [Tanacetum coccineum]|uniref:Uncharacterized protein n=1 Tax=Tanacetum coccineum TaxID=301880 RepID=A0ABQ4XFV5_9ASTR
MLAPSGGGLILYQAYGNLYSMTGSISCLVVGIKRLLDDLRVTAAKLLLLVLKVNAAGMKVTTAERLQLLEEYADREKIKDLSEKE